MGLLKVALWVFFGLVLIAALIFFFFAGTYVDQQRNRSHLDSLPQISERARSLHPRLRIADWHSDNLLWDRDPLQRIEYGHVDIPRLIEGNVAIQVFDAVIKTPRGQNYHRTEADTDNITLLAMANRWPPRTWFSLFERATYQSRLLHRAARHSDGRLTLITSRSGLTQFLDARWSNPQQVGGLLSIEGLHALEGKLENLDKLYEEGYRIMGLVHFFDNRIGGSSSGVEKGGLTDFGKKVVRRMEEKKITIDLAHASPALVRDVLEMATRPVIVSHTGVKGTHDSPRNLSDDEVRAIAENGGVLGIGFWEGAVGGAEPLHIARAMRYTAELVGIDHVCLGSDFDGSVYTWFDASQMIVLTDALLEAGFNEMEIRKIMGENQIRFLSGNLPE